MKNCIVEKTSQVKQPSLSDVRKIGLFLLRGREDTNLDPSFQAVLTGLSQQLFCNKIQSEKSNNLLSICMLDNEGQSRKPGYVSEGGHGYQPGLVVFHDGSIITNGSLHILWLSARICHSP
jgi:hypothetical protein